MLSLIKLPFSKSSWEVTWKQKWSEIRSNRTKICFMQEEIRQRKATGNNNSLEINNHEIMPVLQVKVRTTKLCVTS